jgi:hypothetical protein
MILLPDKKTASAAGGAGKVTTWLQVNLPWQTTGDHPDMDT